MSSAGLQVLEFVSGQLWDLLERCRRDAAVALAALGPEPGFSGTILDGRLLTAIRADAIVSDDPAVSALVGAMRALLPDPAGADVPVRLHGFDPGSGQPRGLAMVVATSSPAVTVVAALTGAGPSGLAIEIAAVGAGAFQSSDLPLLEGWSVAAGGDIGGGARLQFTRGAPPSVLDNGTPVRVTWDLKRAGGGQPIVLGPAAGPHASLGGITLGATTGVDGGAMPTYAFTLSSPGAQLALATESLATIVGADMTMPIDLDLVADPDRGVAFRAGGLRVSLPTSIDLPGVELHALEIGLSTGGGGIQFDVGVALSAGLPGLPLSFSIDGLGAAFPVALGAGRLGIDPSTVRPAMPSGLGADLALPVLGGGGFLATVGPGGYAGVLELELATLAVEAFGILQLPVDGVPISFAGILSIRFPFPGIQLGFGFSLNAVGGIIALNRRLDTAALHDAITDGSAAQVLFPVDPARHAPAIVATLGRLFPPSSGHVVIGPMLEIAWGGRIISMELAVVIDLPNPTQLVIVGRIVLALPDPAAPLIFIQATLVGAFEISPRPSTSLQASLDGSYFVGVPLHGDVFFLLRTGDDAAFVLSVGGFHPRFLPPAGVPRGMQRIQLDLTPPGFPGMRSEAYVAVTSNSVQFGAHLELCDEIAGCGVDGWFDFDALFIWDPAFAFSVHCSAGVAVQVLGDTLMGVNFDLVLEGPAKWHVHGSGSVDLFLFSASLDFDVSWGSAPAALPPPPDLGPVFAAAFANPAAWIGAPPAEDQSMVTLSASAVQSIGEGNMVHPLGGVVVRQRAVPLDIEIARYQNQPIPSQSWSIVGAEPRLGDRTTDEFPAGEFLNLSEDEKLARPAFERFTSGAMLSQGGVAAADFRSVDTDFEVFLIPEPVEQVPIVGAAFLLAAAEAWLLIEDVHATPDIWRPPGVEPITVLPAQPLAAASTATLREQTLVGSPHGFTETLQAARAQFGAVGPAAAVQVVEQWELAA